MFANLGDGTYFHSGILAIRAAVAASVNITYKILYNDAVAMTGGQPLEGSLTRRPARAASSPPRALERIEVVADEAEAAQSSAPCRPASASRRATSWSRSSASLRETKGTTALIYVQTCAAEKRRRRKRGSLADPARRVVINDMVCEGCGDCSNKSNCVSVLPVDTEWGTKREIDQSNCNKDYSCLNGFCPSFVTVEGGKLRKGKALAGGADLPPAARRPSCLGSTEPWGILITGVGGTGVVTIGAILCMAAHLEGKGVTALDMAGLAQKGGSVWSHVRIAADPGQLWAPRIAAGEADAVIGCDIVVTVGDESLAKMQLGRTRAVVNSDLAVTSEFVRTVAEQARTGDLDRYRDPEFPTRAMEDQIVDAVGADAAWFLDASRLATALMGDAIATNMFMLGCAWQKGLVPAAARRRSCAAIELNGAAVALNQAAFQWGRRAARRSRWRSRRWRHRRDADADQRRLSRQPRRGDRTPRRTILTGYQDAAYAERYRALVERVRKAEAERVPGQRRADRGRGPQPAQAHGLQGRVRGRPALHRHRLPASGSSAMFEGDWKLKLPPGAAAPGGSSIP